LQQLFKQVQDNLVQAEVERSSPMQPEQLPMHVMALLDQVVVDHLQRQLFLSVMQTV
jgi:hypothetical protein